MSKVKEGYLEDPEATKLLQELSTDSAVDSSFSVQDGILRHKGRVWLGNNSLAQQHVIQAMHTSGVGGYSGFQASYYRIRQLFSWPNMKNSIKDFIKSCSVC